MKEITFERREPSIKTFAHHKNDIRKSYVVLLNGKPIGIVEQAERHSYKVHGRVRYGDSYSIKWQPQSLNGACTRSHRLYAGSRKQALLWLLEDLNL